METVLQANVFAWIQHLNVLYTEQKDYLTDLDAAIGDADHGINMNRGFNAVAAALNENSPETVSDVLKTVAMTLIRTVGGASGPLYGTFFLRASAAVQGKESLNASDVAAFFEAGLAGVIERGKAQQNDKTMVDVLAPAVSAMKAALDAGGTLSTVLQNGISAAEWGMRQTIDMLALKGRASYLGSGASGIRIREPPRLI